MISNILQPDIEDVYFAKYKRLRNHNPPEGSCGSVRYLLWVSNLLGSLFHPNLANVTFFIQMMPACNLSLLLNIKFCKLYQWNCSCSKPFGTKNMIRLKSISPFLVRMTIRHHLWRFLLITQGRRKMIQPNLGSLLKVNENLIVRVWSSLSCHGRTILGRAY